MTIQGGGAVHSPDDGSRRLGIVMYGITGRMGLNQHLIRSIVAIRAEAGVALADGCRGDAGSARDPLRTGAITARGHEPASIVRPIRRRNAT
jgi:hypothetical protein